MYVCIYTYIYIYNGVQAGRVQQRGEPHDLVPEPHDLLAGCRHRDFAQPFRVRSCKVMWYYIIS